MSIRKRLFYLSSIVLFAFFLAAISLHADDSQAVATMVDGKAYVYAKGAGKAGAVLRKNDRVQSNQEIRVGERSRVELRFPDGTIMRFAEKSVVRMEDLSFDAKTQNKKVKVDMGGGKLWANVKKLVTSDSKVEVKTVNAVAGVRGTVYRVNVEDDNSAMIKVYDGSVYVDGKQQGTSQKTPASGPPVPVSGPHEVPPPYHEVTMEEWHVIVKSFQQITISPQGLASKPEEFNAQQDMDDWVKWNQERDRQLAL
ncbi:MAG: FecR family protein [Nitrospirota bacterium]|nr:FecR family protein [Nitrospirota bacterium]